MDCAQFLESYSDFLDRRLEVYPLSEYRDHIVSCRACARYDRVMQRGLCLVRDIELAAADPDFEPRLRERFFHRQEGIARYDAMLSRVASVAMLSAAALLVAVALPTIATSRTSVELPPVVVETPAVYSASSRPTLFDFAASIAPDGKLLLLPDFPEESWLNPRSGRLSLFRAPLRVAPLSRPELEIEAAE